MHCSQLNTCTFLFKFKARKSRRMHQRASKTQELPGPLGGPLTPANKGTMCSIVCSLASLGQLVYTRKGQEYPISHTP